MSRHFVARRVRSLARCEKESEPRERVRGLAVSERSGARSAPPQQPQTASRRATSAVAKRPSQGPFGTATALCVVLISDPHARRSVQSSGAPSGARVPRGAQRSDSQMKATTIIARTGLLALASACSGSPSPPAAAPEQPAAAEHGTEPAAAPEKASITEQSYGQVDGKEVSLYTRSE